MVFRKPGDKGVFIVGATVRRAFIPILRTKPIHIFNALSLERVAAFALTFLRSRGLAFPTLAQTTHSKAKVAERELPNANCNPGAASLADRVDRIPYVPCPSLKPHALSSLVAQTTITSPKAANCQHPASPKRAIRSMMHRAAKAPIKPSPQRGSERKYPSSGAAAAMNAATES